MACVTPPRRGVIQACSWLPADFTHGPFPFGDGAMCPFTVINHCCEYDYIESGVFKASHQNGGGGGLKEVWNQGVL